MINWVSNSKTAFKIKGDISVTLISKGEQVLVKVTQGAMSVKFGHADRILVGFDDAFTRCYLKKGSGYKVKPNKDGSASFMIQAKKLENVTGHRCSQLAGDYILSYDKEADAYFFSIGALPR